MLCGVLLRLGDYCGSRLLLLLARRLDDGGMCGLSGGMCMSQLCVGHVERLDLVHHGTQLLERDALRWVGRKDVSQDGVEVLGDGEDGAEELIALAERAKGVVRGTRLTPWVATARQVDEDDPERPNVIGWGRVGVDLVRSEATLAFGAHVKRGPATEIRRALFTRGQSEIGEVDVLSAVGTQDVFRLEVTMVDAERVAVFDGVDDLQEHALDQRVVADIPLTVGDHAKQVSILAIVEDDVDEFPFFDRLVHGHDVAMCRGELMERNLAALELSLARVERGFEQALDRVLAAACRWRRRRRTGRRRMMERVRLRAGRGVDGTVHDTVRTDAEHGDEFESAVVDAVAEHVVGAGKPGRRRGRGGGGGHRERRKEGGGDRQKGGIVPFLDVLV